MIMYVVSVVIRHEKNVELEMMSSIMYITNLNHCHWLPYGSRYWSYYPLIFKRMAASALVK